MPTIYVSSWTQHGPVVCSTGWCGAVLETTEARMQHERDTGHRWYRSLPGYRK